MVGRREYRNVIQNILKDKGDKESYILEFAPDKIELKGSHFIIEGTEQPRQYERLEYRKTDLIDKLEI